MTSFPNRGFYRGDLNAALKDYGNLLAGPVDPLFDTKVPLEPVQEEPLYESTHKGITETLTTGEVARFQGFTGNQCTKCNSMRVVMTGHCETCQDCGETSSCG